MDSSIRRIDSPTAVPQGSVRSVDRRREREQQRDFEEELGKRQQGKLGDEASVQALPTAEKAHQDRQVSPPTEGEAGINLDVEA